MARWTNSPHWWHDPLTERQHVAVELIQERLGIRFDGSVKGEAMGFIGKYYELAKKFRAEDVTIEVVTNRKLAKHILEEENPWES